MAGAFSTKTRMNKLLSEDEVAAYERRGIVFPIPVLSKEETARFRGAYETFCEQLGSRPNAAQSRNPHLFHRWAYDLATHPRVLDVVEQIIGPNILVHHGSLFCKYPRDGTFVSWHQDGYYLELNEPLLVSAWIALSDSNTANGCMRVVSESHCNGGAKHSNSAISEKNLLPSGLEIACEVDERDATDVVLRAGEMSLHHVNLVHGSKPNHSTEPRLGFAVRYVAPSVRQAVASVPTILARGRDDEGHFEHLEAPPAYRFAEAIAAQAELVRWTTEARKVAPRVQPHL
jgi:ectoine hydroxylase-related dioxygenase (phytanoyl-CoA dioxygenase family)